MDNDKTKIINLLQTVKIEGMDKLIKYIQESDYFIAPASTKYHGSYTGGLAEHSLKVYNIFKDKVKYYNLDIELNSIIICSLLHDVCKVGLYKGSEGNYSYDREIIKEGHSKRSIEIIKQFITLKEQEEMIIKYHMGFYGTEIIPYSQEYSSKEYMDAGRKEPLVILFHHSDNEENYFPCGIKKDLEAQK